ncbi:hypothetical protein B0H17DRAFT_1096361 [Mycena rosella]|uniref:DUF6534 domain-containing protein n=1 Tax=Mycena rosella TaxID=1033263 RepID=A0AAD7CTG9_MYCRO|nr:hypothetical protein B0H17DRAFT_1096361 [Mycena rosella]
MAVATSSLAFAVATFDDGARLTPVVIRWLSVTVVDDLSITACLVFYLHRSRTGLSKTDNALSRLSRSGIDSAAFATFFSIMVLITFTKLPSTGFHLLFSIPMGRIYTITLLSTLNQRDSLRHDLSGTRNSGELDFHSISIGNRTPEALTVNIKKRRWIPCTKRLGVIEGVFAFLSRALHILLPFAHAYSVIIKARARRSKPRPG